MLRRQVLLDESLKHNMVLTSKILKKKITDVNKKIFNTNGLVKKTNYNTKFAKIENKIPKIFCSITTANLDRKEKT